MDGIAQNPDLSPTSQTEKVVLINEEEQRDDRPWYAMKLFTTRQNEIAEALREKQLEVFIPMQYTDVEDGKNRVRQVLRPVVRNLIFIKKTQVEKAMRELVLSLPYNRKKGIR